MGLAAPKRRNKLSHDPNNTGWLNSVDSYGQKILSAQGWKPGEYLGARDASHAEHYTAANKSHIRILLREDNLGLGAQVGKSNAETFGLSLYSGVLSRLNGKSDVEVEKQQSALRDAELRTYQASKYGFMNFVRGGVLVGDTIEREDPDNSNASTTERNSKKRKLDAVAAEDSARQTTAETTVQESKDAKPSVDSSEKRTSKKKSKKKAKDIVDTDQSSADSDVDKRKLKEEKRARKEERRKRKEEKRKRKAEKKTSSVAPTEDEDQQSSDEPRSGTQTPTVNGGRLAVRRRYINSKRMASLDPKAMREIFMVKTGA